MSEKGYRETLVFVAGMTPQIITETIYALAKKNPPIYADEIFIITTKAGESCITETLIGQGILKRLEKELSIPEIPLNESSFVLIKDKSGNILDDIRCDSDNEALGNLICDFLSRKTEDSGTRLHCSIAGGRKTMSFYLGTALQLFGRAWDKLYHVLVTPEFESIRDFYYKPEEDRIINVTDNRGNVVKQLSTRNAEISLSELPFIRLRDKIRFDSSVDFSRLMTECQREIDIAISQPKMTIDLEKRIVLYGGKSVEMVASELVFYLFFLRQKTDRCIKTECEYCLDCTDCFLSMRQIRNKKEVAKEIRKDYERIYGDSGRLDHFDETYIKKRKSKKKKPGIRAGIFLHKITKINDTLSKGLNNDTLHSLCKISAVGPHGGRRYGVRMEKGRIEILNPEVERRGSDERDRV